MQRYMGIGLAAGAVVGGLIGYWLGVTSAAGTLVTSIIGFILGAIGGGAVGLVLQWLFPQKERSSSEEGRVSDEAKLTLREERLEINKERVRTGEVHVHRERIEEERTIRVPVVREEVVIEAQEGTGDEATSRTIRIPVKEERVEVQKREMVTGDVKVYTNKYKSMEKISETLRKEAASVEVDGQADVKEEHVQAPH